MTHGTGVIKNDIARNIYIPDELAMPLLMFLSTIIVAINAQLLRRARI